MGAWGAGPLENDAALDIVEAWKRFRTGAYAEESHTSESTFDHFLGAGLGDTMDWGDIDTTSRIIALAELFRRDGLPIRGKVKGYFEEAINWELRPDALSEWDDPKARRRALGDLLSGIGGVRRSCFQGCESGSAPSTPVARPVFHPTRSILGFGRSSTGSSTTGSGTLA